MHCTWVIPVPSVSHNHPQISLKPRTGNATYIENKNPTQHCTGVHKFALCGTTFTSFLSYTRYKMTSLLLHTWLSVTMPM